MRFYKFFSYWGHTRGDDHPTDPGSPRGEPFEHADDALDDVLIPEPRREVDDDLVHGKGKRGRATLPGRPIGGVEGERRTAIVLVREEEVRLDPPLQQPHRRLDDLRRQHRKGRRRGRQRHAVDELKERRDGQQDKVVGGRLQRTTVSVKLTAEKNNADDTFS